MTTRDNLELAVIAAMAEAGRNVMAWGRDDCALWCADIVRDALGYDLGAPFRGRYKTRRGAMRVLGRNGLKGLLQRTARYRHWKRIHPTLAQPGDLGLAWTRVALPGRKPTEVLATVICRANHWFVARNEKGFTAIPARDVAMAWSVLNDACRPEPGTRVAKMRPYRPAAAPAYAACHDPVSDAIGLTAIISTLIGGSSILGVTASAIGGFLLEASVSVGLSKSASIHRGAAQ
jgi:hypothetical protein